MPNSTLNKIIDISIRLIQALRPRFYNKLTWVIVLSGLGLMSTSLFEKLLFLLLEVNFEIKVTSGNDAFWGFSLVLMGLAYHVITTSLYETFLTKGSRLNQKRQLEHDRDNFRDSERIMTEVFLMDYLYNLECNHDYYTKERGKVSEFCFYLSQFQNRFFNDDINQKASNLLVAIHKLHSFTSLNFWVFPNAPNYHEKGNMRLCMHPHWNIDREGSGSSEELKKYQEAEDQLYELTKGVKDSYEDFRHTIKSHLFI